MKLVAPAAVALVALAVSSASTQAASVTVDSQDRSVSVSIPAASDDRSLDIFDRVDASDSDLFDVTLDRTLTNVQPGFTQVSTAMSSQTSSFGTVLGQFVADAGGSTTYDSRQTETLTFAESDFSVTFTLDEAMPFAVSGFNRYTSSGGGASASGVRLTGAGGSVFGFFRGGSDGPGDGSIITDPFDEAGTLAAGTYTLTASSGVSGGVGGTAAGYDVDFTVGTVIPSPAALPAGLALLGGMVLGVRRGARPGTRSPIIDR